MNDYGIKWTLLRWEGHLSMAEILRSQHSYITMKFERRGLVECEAWLSEDEMSILRNQCSAVDTPPVPAAKSDRIDNT